MSSCSSPPPGYVFVRNGPSGKPIYSTPDNQEWCTETDEDLEFVRNCIREAIEEVVDENNWGLKRIKKELKKGIKDLSSRPLSDEAFFEAEFWANGIYEPSRVWISLGNTDRMEVFLAILGAIINMMKIRLQFSWKFSDGHDFEYKYEAKKKKVVENVYSVKVSRKNE